MGDKMFKFGQRSLDNLQDVNEDLRNVMLQTIKLTPIDFGITEGMRSLERAEQLKNEGLSKVGSKSKHCQGKAVDIVCYNNGEVTWELDFYEAVAQVVGEVSELIDVPIRWGGSWQTGVFVLNRDMKFIDAVHFELGE
jgi:peptidoglycan L-alanyl-D-glutamate endopeptidase CwlK